MCQLCQPIRAYQQVASADQLHHIKENAFSMVEDGTFSIINDFSNEDLDYSEVQFLCENCGQVHVLWLHTFMCRTGGEWRSMSLA